MELTQKSRAEADQARILAGARRHFFAHGFRGVTMDDLASELGMSKKTLYTHFASKAALLQAVLADKFARVQADLAAAVAGGGEFPERLHRLLAAVRKHTEEVQPPFTRDVARETPELFELVKNRRAAMIRQYFGALLAEGRNAKMIREDVPEALLIEFLIGAADAIANPQKLGELGLTVEAAFGEIITVFLEGAATEQGRLKL
jgi:AcrR family transcriptional regulator